MYPEKIHISYLNKFSVPVSISHTSGAAFTLRFTSTCDCLWTNMYEHAAQSASPCTLLTLFGEICLLKVSSCIYDRVSFTSVSLENHDDHFSFHKPNIPFL